MILSEVKLKKLIKIDYIAILKKSYRHNILYTITYILYLFNLKWYRSELVVGMLELKPEILEIQKYKYNVIS